MVSNPNPVLFINHDDEDPKTFSHHKNISLTLSTYSHSLDETRWFLKTPSDENSILDLANILCIRCFLNVNESNSYYIVSAIQK